MAKPNDNKKGQMLFTEFDLSDKGRAARFVDEDADGFMKYPLPSITEIASSLGLDFEDDADSSSTDPESMTGSGGNLPKPPAAPDSGRTEELPFSKYRTPPAEEPAERDASSLTTRLNPIEPRTWEEVANAFQSAEAEPGARAELITSPSPAKPPPPSPVASPPSPRTVTDLPGARIPASQIAQPSPALQSKATRVISPPDSMESDSEVDILSSLSFGDEAEADTTTTDYFTEEDGATKRLDWYQPPEDTSKSIGKITDWYEPPEDSSPPVMHVDDWYESPEDASASAGTKSGLVEESDFGTGISGRRQADETAVDLFSDLDLDGEWYSKLDSSNHAQDADATSASGRFRGTDTRSIDLFSDLDLNSIWEEKTGHDSLLPGEGDEALQTVAHQAVEAAETLILNADILAASGLGGTTPAPAPAASTPFSDADEQNTDFHHGKTRRITQNGHVDKRKAEPQENGESLTDLEDFLNSGESSDMFADDDSDTGAYDAVNEPGEDAEDEAASLDETEPSADIGGDDGDMLNTVDEIETEGEEGEGDNSESSEGGGQPGHFTVGRVIGAGVATDDFLDDIEINFPDESVDPEISAPVIDDSHIDVPTGNRPRPGTEEMQALMEEGEFTNPDTQADEDSDTEGAGEEEAGPAADEVAVNPMDVFSNLDDMDFSGDFADDIPDLLDDDDEEDGDALNIDVDGFTGPLPAAAGSQSASRLDLVKHLASHAFYKVVPQSVIKKIKDMVAWRENWWFYCDLLAAIIASASLAVIISYYLWYRD